MPIPIYAVENVCCLLRYNVANILLKYITLKFVFRAEEPIFCLSFCTCSQRLLLPSRPRQRIRTDGDVREPRVKLEVQRLMLLYSLIPHIDQTCYVFRRGSKVQLIALLYAINTFDMRPKEQQDIKIVLMMTSEARNSVG